MKSSTSWSVLCQVQHELAHRMVSAAGKLAQHVQLLSENSYLWFEVAILTVQLDLYRVTRVGAASATMAPVPEYREGRLPPSLHIRTKYLQQPIRLILHLGQVWHTIGLTEPVSPASDFRGHFSDEQDAQERA